jgi:prolyl-tRNA synthetase
MTAAAPAPKPIKTAVSPTRADNYPEWYQQVIKAADMAENSGVRGCMVIKPWGFGVWDLVKNDLDRRFKDTGHENAYFPLFIPLSLIAKEATHVDGFAKEMAVVTHHRVSMKDGKMVPDGLLEEPLVVRPTSETIIGEAFARWVNSYRDLPLLINQWCNVVRWEMRTRLFLRTAEFLWQEGHTAHANEKEAMEETRTMLDVYAAHCNEALALPVIKGYKSPAERFPGAVITMGIETMMQDGKALQAGTSHYLGQNFSKPAGIKFQNKEGVEEFAYTTSWGASTRLIGNIIMAHADDNGLRLPPRVAPQQVVIVPIFREEADRASVLDYANKVAAAIKAQSYANEAVRVKVDTRDLAGPDKRWQWIKKGVPLVLEVGPRDVEGQNVAVTKRTTLDAKKEIVNFAVFAAQAPQLLSEVHTTLFSEAEALLGRRMRTDIKTYDELKAFFGPSGEDSYNTGQGFVRAKWCGEEEAYTAKLKELGLTIRCIPLEQTGTPGVCLMTGKPATEEIIIARAY